MKTIEEISEALFEALSDGKWHTLNELTTIKRLRDVSISKLMIVLTFLVEYDFADSRPMVGGEGDSVISIMEVRLEEGFQNFLRALGEIDGKNDGNDWKKARQT